MCVGDYTLGCYTYHLYFYTTKVRKSFGLCKFSGNFFHRFNKV